MKLGMNSNLILFLLLYLNYKLQLQFVNESPEKQYFNKSRIISFIFKINPEN